MLEITYNQTDFLPKEKQSELLETISTVLQYTFSHEIASDVAYEMDVTFMDNETIHEVNMTYRGVDRATDVISFAFNDSEDEIVMPEGMEIPQILGELFISVEKTIEQASEYGHSFERELYFLAVHGMLHLLGYDHQTPEEEQVMFAKQEAILQHFEIKR